MIESGRNCFHRAGQMLEDTRNGIDRTLSNNYYIQKRAVIHGLFIALISATALGCLFESASLFACAAYGVMNYAVTTTLIELFDPSRKYKLIDLLVFAAGLAICTPLINLVLRLNMTFLQAFPMSCGVYIAQFARGFRTES